MVTTDRRVESRPFLKRSPLRRLGPHNFTYPSLRQGLYRFFLDSPPSRVLLPDFVPEGVYSPFEKLGADIRFYSVNQDLGIRSDQLLALARDFRPEVAIVIHYFGVVIEGRTRTFRDIFPDALLVEDCAHTVDSPGLAHEGDLCLFSDTKMLGVAEGAHILVRTPGSHTPSYGPSTDQERHLRLLLERRLRREHLLSTVFRSRWAQGLYLRLNGSRADYYEFLCDHYTELTAPTSPRWLRAFERADLARIAEKRRRLARLYCDLLDPSLQLRVGRDALLRAALFGFPVLVPNRNAFHAHLVANGIRGLTCADRWWFDHAHPPSRLHQQHYLLPVNHHLTEREVRRVAGVVGRWKGNGDGDGEEC